MAYLRLFRYQNLLMIILTQYLLRYFIIIPFFNTEGIGLCFTDFHFFLLVLATVLITAGGYVINDYCDLRIDRINKPDKLILGRVIPRRKGIVLHQLFTVSGVLIGFYLSWVVGSFKPALVFLFISSALWFYSVKFKHVYLIGNSLIALLSAFVLLIVWMFEFFALKSVGLIFISDIDQMKLLLWGFVIFTFLGSLTREIIKDMEDVEGDKRVGSRTIPAVSGIRFAGIIAIILLVLQILLMAYFAFLLYQKELFILLVYYVCTFIIPFIFITIKIPYSKSSKDFHFLSSILKLTMFAGILSMLIIYNSLK